MKRLLRPMALPFLLVAGIGGVAWVWAHQGYPDPVYYRRVSFGGSAQTLVMEEWVDPQRRVIRRRQAWLGSAGDLIIRDGRVYSLEAGVPIGGIPVSPAVRLGLGYLFDGLAAGGFAGLGRQLLLHRIGPVDRLRIGVRPALCFGSDGFDLDALSEVVCLDPRTSVPVGERITMNQGTVEDALYADDRRFPPYALPAGIFDLPNSRRTWWDQLLGWVRDQLRPASVPCRASSSTAASSACR